MEQLLIIVLSVVQAPLVNSLVLTHSVHLEVLAVVSYEVQLVSD